MLEIPEASVLAAQLNEYVAGRKVVSVTAGQSPHKLAWFYGEPEFFEARMRGKVLERSYAVGGHLELAAGEMRVLFSEGVGLRLIGADGQPPARHQLLLGLDNGCWLCASVQMYGGLGCFADGENQNPYYLTAREKPALFSSGFDFDYFCSITGGQSLRKKSAKALLATEQRIPGLGNGVLQDILYNARIHPKRRMDTVDDDEFGGLFDCILSTLEAMIREGGRDTESDLFGRPGGYRTLCSKHTVGTACGRCGEIIEKAAYMGGSVYFCPGCQPL